MGEPMEEDPIPQVGEEETTTPTTDPALVRRRKKLLGFLLAVAELFDEKHPQLGLRELCEGLTRDDESTLEARPSDFGTRTSSIGSTFENYNLNFSHSPTWDNGAVELRVPPTHGRPIGSDSRLRGESNPSPGAEAYTTKPLIPGFVISTKRTPWLHQERRRKTLPLTSSPQTLAMDQLENIRSQEEYNSGWLRNFAGDRSAPLPDFNLYPYKGWKIEPPQVLLSRAKNFLADEDVNRAIDWDRKFAELAEYFSYLLHNWKGERWGADLHECIDMLHASVSRTSPLRQAQAKS
ncbi:hypothetical protein NCS56_00262400 [Fusarium sp. Ph1]|nr:hypothetical protein NCS56_00262400 [Fusarium sp. Ph1]